MQALQYTFASHGRGAPDEPAALLPPLGSPASPSLTSPGLAETPLTGEGFTFRHFPAENDENVHPTREPFASNPKLASILRCNAHANPLAMVSDPPTSVLPEEDPVQAIPPIVLDDAMVGTRPPPPVPVAEGEPSYARFGDIFWEERSERMAGSESNVGFALSGLTHLGPVRDALKPTGTSISGSSLGQGNSQWSARSKSKHDQQSQSSQSFREPATIIGPEKSDEGISSTTSSFSMTTRSSQGSDGPIVTMRFEHRQDENGHHILIGREGKLTRCGDEPIRVPGTVQGFGVLMVLHDDRRTGKLPVRQVSEVSPFF